MGINISAVLKATSFGLHLREIIFGQDHPETIQTAVNLAKLRKESSDHAGAAILYRRCWGLCKSNLDENQ